MPYFLFEFWLNGNVIMADEIWFLIPPRGTSNVLLHVPLLGEMTLQWLMLPPQSVTSRRTTKMPMGCIIEYADSLRKTFVEYWIYFQHACFARYRDLISLNGYMLIFIFNKAWLYAHDTKVNIANFDTRLLSPRIFHIRYSSATKVSNRDDLAW